MTQRITITLDIPAGVEADVQYAQSSVPSRAAGDPPPPAATGGTPSCPDHGLMTFKEGTSAKGKPYAGHFCDVRDCDTTPVWAKNR